MCWVGSEPPTFPSHDKRGIPPFDSYLLIGYNLRMDASSHRGCFAAPLGWRGLDWSPGMFMSIAVIGAHGCDCFRVRRTSSDTLRTRNRVRSDIENSVFFLKTRVDMSGHGTGHGQSFIQPTDRTTLTSKLTTQGVGVDVRTREMTKAVRAGWLRHPVGSGRRSPCVSDCWTRNSVLPWLGNPLPSPTRPTAAGIER